MAPDLRFRGSVSMVVAAVEALESRGEHPLKHPPVRPPLGALGDSVPIVRVPPEQRCPRVESTKVTN